MALIPKVVLAVIELRPVKVLTDNPLTVKTFVVASYVKELSSAITPLAPIIATRPDVKPLDFSVAPSTVVALTVVVDNVFVPVLNVNVLASLSKPPTPANVTRVAVKPLSVMLAEVTAVALMFVAVNVLVPELYVKPALSLNNPAVPANVTRVAVKVPTVTPPVVSNVSALISCTPISPALNAPLASRITIVLTVLFGVALLVNVTTPVAAFTLKPPADVTPKLVTPSLLNVIASVVASAVILIAVPPTNVNVSSL